MANKEFQVRSTKTGEELTLTGKDLADALTKEGLSPSIWQEAKPVEEPPEAPFGED